MQFNGPIKGFCAEYEYNYTVGSTYEIPDWMNSNIGRRGFCFYENPVHCREFYDPREDNINNIGCPCENNRNYYEIVAWNAFIDEKYDKSIAGKIQIVREFTEQEWITLSGNLVNTFGHQIWYENCKFHRIDGPAVIFPDGRKYWYQNGLLHRIDGPVIEDLSGFSEWRVNGKLHRTDGPAIIYGDNDKSWYQNGKLHRIDGPAVIQPNGTKEWYVDGEVKQIVQTDN